MRWDRLGHLTAPRWVRAMFSPSRGIPHPLRWWTLRLCAEPTAFSFTVPVKVKQRRKNVAVCYRGREVKRAGNLHHVHFPLAPGRCSFRIRDLRRQS